MYEMLGVLFLNHWLGDFVCQTRWMANNKSKNPWALTLHVTTYSLVLFVGLLNPWLTFADKVTGEALLWFIGVNFVLHWLTDITTSQFTKYFWAKQDVHKFFVVVGLDQLIHQLCLMTTARMFFNV